MRYSPFVKMEQIHPVIVGELVLYELNFHQYDHFFLDNNHSESNFAPNIM